MNNPFRQSNAAGSILTYKHVRFLVNFIIIYHLFAFTLWNMPSSRLKTACLPFIQRYLHYTCLWQSWAMFQQPGLDNIFMSARIKFADGSQKEWYIGRQDNLGPWDRLMNERFRKMMEHVFNKEQAVHYPHLANWAARRNSRDPRNPPVSVEILRYWYPIEKPSGQIKQLPVKPVTQWYSDIVYSSPMGDPCETKKKNMEEKLWARFDIDTYNGKKYYQ